MINAQLSTVKLVIKPNREAVLFDGGVPLAGEIEASENQLTLSYSNVAGVEQKQGSPAKRVSFQWTKDGNLRLDGLTLVRKSDSPN